MWAVIVADIENPFFTSVVRGIENAARDRGYVCAGGPQQSDRYEG